MANGQYEGQVMTILIPCISLMDGGSGSAGIEGDGHPRSAGRLRTNFQTRTVRTKVITPTTTKDRRHPIKRLIKANGVVALSDPMPPIAIKMPVMVANSRGRNHSDSTFMLGTKIMAVGAT